MPKLTTDPTTVLASNDEVSVDYDTRIADDDTTITIRRTVWRKSARTKFRDLLHQETIVQLDTAAAIELVRDLASSLAWANGT